MGVSCSDFTDGILELLVEHGFVRDEDLPEDDPGRQLKVASAAIQRLAGVKALAVGLAATINQGGPGKEELANKAGQLLTACETIAPPYLVCDGWEHIFSGKRTTLTRWVMDLRSGKMAMAQKFSGDWIDMNSGDVDDLLESVRDANNVRANPEDFGAVTADVLPAW